MQIERCGPGFLRKTDSFQVDGGQTLSEDTATFPDLTVLWCRWSKQIIEHERAAKGQ